MTGFQMRQRRVIFVIPCGAAKLDRPAPARDLYTSSTFRSTLAAALTETDEVYVLSAEHGLVALDTVVAPYDTKMTDRGSIDEATLLVQATRLFGDDDVDVYGMLPRAYFDRLDGALRNLGVWMAEVYEATAGIGEQRHVASVITATA